MTEYHKTQLDKEIANCLKHGFEQVSPEEFEARYKQAGFRFDKSCTIKQFSRYVTGPLAGESTPDQTMYPVHIETGLSAFHVDLPREEYEKVKVLRNSIFAVTRSGYVMTV